MEVIVDDDEFEKPAGLNGSEDLQEAEVAGQLLMEMMQNWRLVEQHTLIAVDMPTEKVKTKLMMRMKACARYPTLVDASETGKHQSFCLENEMRFPSSQVSVFL